MKMSLISLLLLSFLSHLTILNAHPFEGLRYNNCSEDTGKYTDTSIYKSNLDTLLSDLTSNTKIDYGFYNSSYGQNPNKVSAIGLCRGDVRPIECRNCLNNATRLLRQQCPDYKEVLGGFDECMLRYSNESSILGVSENGISVCLHNPSDATEVEKYSDVVRGLLDKLSGEAASGDSLRKFAQGNQTGPNFQRVFGVAQCVPYLSGTDCTNCLVKAISEIPECSGTKKGGRVIKPSCNFRYESEPFFHNTEDSTQASSPLSPPTSTTKGNNHKSGTVIIIVVLIVACVGLLIVLRIYFGMRKTRKTKKTMELEIEAAVDSKIKPAESIQFDFETIKHATDNFSDANKLGQGGFGPVYKGTLNDGLEVAIKRLSKQSDQGDKEFKNEVRLMANLRHRNLVRLLGFCLEGEERLLVYEFLPKKSLDYFLFDPDQRANLSWDIRYKIIRGIARGLLYLHEDSQERIIHRDLKVSNILLDEELNPKISDFGLARLFVVDKTQIITSNIVGTRGYMAPEYIMSGELSPKLDVFSFGVLVLEIVSGKKNIEDLLNIAWKNWKNETASNIVDSSLNNGSQIEIMRCINIGLLCVQENVEDRPTMDFVVHIMLGSKSFPLSSPSQPPFSQPPFSMGTSNVSEMHSESSSGQRRSSEIASNSIHA